MNVASQRADPRSVLSLFRRPITLRQQEPAFQGSTLEPLRSHGDVPAFRRRSAAGRAVPVALNLGGLLQGCRFVGDAS